VIAGDPPEVYQTHYHCDVQIYKLEGLLEKTRKDKEFFKEEAETAAALVRHYEKALKEILKEATHLAIDCTDGTTCIIAELVREALKE